MTGLTSRGSTRLKAPWQSYAMSAVICARRDADRRSRCTRCSTSPTSSCCSCWRWCWSSVRYGRGPAVLAAFLSVAAFDFFYVPPRFSFAVSDVQYLLTFAVMLVVAWSSAS